MENINELNEKEDQDFEIQNTRFQKFLALQRKVLLSLIKTGETQPHHKTRGGYDNSAKIQKND